MMILFLRALWATSVLDPLICCMLLFKSIASCCRRWPGERTSTAWRHWTLRRCCIRVCSLISTRSATSISGRAAALVAEIEQTFSRSRTSKYKYVLIMSYLSEPWKQWIASRARRSAWRIHEFKKYHVIELKLVIVVGYYWSTEPWCGTGRC